MKKLLAFFLLTTTFVHAQFTIKGTMYPPQKSNWVILYKIEGARQVFVKNTTTKLDTILLNEKKQAVANFQFNLPKEAESGSYRVSFKAKNTSFVDFLFNKENVEFLFNPLAPEESIFFTKSKENRLYQEYLNVIYESQHLLDSIQVSKLQNPAVKAAKNYKIAFQQTEATQKKYVEKSKGMLVHHFIKATYRKNPPEIIPSMQGYLNFIGENFLANMDFTNLVLYNSSFLVDRINDYVFYLNYSDDKAHQKELHQKAIAKVLSKITEVSFQKDVVEFLIEQFSGIKNTAMVDLLFEKYYSKLPKEFQDSAFKSQKLADLAAEVGRIAPNFSWTEGTKSYELKTLKGSNSYVLVFWSTGCPHCLREIPQLHTFMKDKNTKVIAFSLEKNDKIWKNYTKELNGWHHVLGLNKWTNKTARAYQIFSTPSYFILDADKKIIAKPETIEEVQQFFTKE